MKNAYAELKSLRQSWDTARASRPSEADFGSFGFKDANASDFDDVFEGWDKALSAAASSTKPANASEEKVVELIIIRALREAKAQVDAAASNGFGWLLQSSVFLQKIGEAQVAMAPVIEKRFRLRKEVVQFAQDQLTNDITSVEQAAPLALTLVEAQRTIEKQSESVVASLDEAVAAKDKVELEAASVKEKLEHVSQLAQQVSDAKVGFDAAVNDATTLLGTAETTLKAVEDSRKSADQKVSQSAELLAQANEKLSKALADINRQALADSFAHKARNLGIERIGWVIGFVAAIVWLVWVAFHMTDLPTSGSSIGTAKDQVILPMWAHLVGSIPFVLPGIWLGWLSAKNAGLTGRVQQDYHYKVATALAYQGYKNEVVGLGDDALTKQLMEIAIRNFGDNPIRIYDGKDEAGHPIEAMKSLFQDEGLSKKWIEFVKAMKQSP